MSRSPEEQTQPTINSVARARIEDRKAAAPGGIHPRVAAEMRARRSHHSAPKAAITEFDSFWALLNISGHGRIVIALFFLGLAASLYLSPRLLQPTEPSHLPALDKTDS